MISDVAAARAVQRMTALRYFPQSEAAHAEIVDMLIDMVSEPQHLEWLVLAMRDQVGEWHGTRELRAVLCTKFKPRDGIEAYSELPGFTPGDIESENLTRHAQLTADSHKRLEGMASGAQLAGLIAAPVEPSSEEERVAIDAIAAKVEKQVREKESEREAKLARRRERIERLRTEHA